MELKYELLYFSSLWFKYWDEGLVYYCQPDGLLFRPQDRQIVILEAKIKHTPDAYFQLERLYLPVIRLAFPGWEVLTCEVVRWYDPAVEFPAPHSLVREVHLARPGEFSVHILNRV
jgi:hypothetical protein